MQAKAAEEKVKKLLLEEENYLKCCYNFQTFLKTTSKESEEEEEEENHNFQFSISTFSFDRWLRLRQ